jgi:hypothetical protein
VVAIYLANPERFDHEETVWGLREFFETLVQTEKNSRENDAEK